MVLERHWLSEVWGEMNPDLYDALLADIKANGIREPIMLYEGKILDGGNRYRAGLEAGCDIPTETLSKDEDPVAFVIRKNALRRPLTATQRGLPASAWCGRGCQPAGRVPILQGRPARGPTSNWRTRQP